MVKNESNQGRQDGIMLNPDVINSGKLLRLDFLFVIPDLVDERAGTK